MPRVTTVLIDGICNVVTKMICIFRCNVSDYWIRVFVIFLMNVLVFFTQNPSFCKDIFFVFFVIG